MSIFGPCSPSSAVSCNNQDREGADPSDPIERAERKPVIAVWAEEYGPLLDYNGYEWSFGNSTTMTAMRGFPLPVSGRAKYMALQIDPETASACVALVVNGTTIDAYKVCKPPSQAVGISRWDESYELAPGDRINFQTVTAGDVRTVSAVVSVLIELDM